MKTLISCFILFSLVLNTAFALTKPKGKTNKSSKSYVKNNKKQRVKVSRYNKKYRRSYRFKRGNGPDIKEITKKSPFEVIPDNGITVIE